MQKAVNCAFVGLEKAYDRELREELWECLLFAESSKCYIRIVKDTYDGATTTVRRATGLTEKFKVGLGIYQGSALSQFFCHHYGQDGGGHQEGRTMGHAVCK